MKKLQDSTLAWRNGDEEPIDGVEWQKDHLLDRLEAEGHKPISVNRAVITIEQCEPSDDFPKGWAEDPLKVTIYPDPDGGFGQIPDELFIHAGRAGVMELFLNILGDDHQRLTRLVPVDAALVEDIRSLNDIAKAEAAKALLAYTFTGRYYEYHRQHSEPKDDAVLAELARTIHDTMQRYVERLRSLPNVYAGQWEKTE